MPLVLIGLTGGIACGKSTVSSLLSDEHHVPIIDADLVVRELQQPGAACTVKIGRRWPSCVDPATGELRREALGHVVFADPAARKDLAKIMNGPIFLTILKRILQHWWSNLCTAAPVVVVLDAPTLFETKLFTFLVSDTLVVACSEERQIQRLASRNGMARDEALRRIHSQMPLEKKRRMAGYVIENDAEGDMADLRASVAAATTWMARQSGNRLTILLAGTTAVVVGAVALGAAAVRSLFF